MTISYHAVTEALLAVGRQISPMDLFPALATEVAPFAIANPYAFALATCLDRQANANVIWGIPYDMHKLLGHLDPFLIRAMSLQELTQLVARLPRKPRYPNAAPRTIQDITAIVCDEFGGDASRIWRGKTAAKVKRTFLRVYGVGEGIANMAPLLLEKAYGFEFIDRPQMDIKPDVHTKRVLYRLGVSAQETEAAAIATARRLNPSFPGGLDAPLWIIGNSYCHSQNPRCTVCPVTKVCARVGV